MNKEYWIWLGNVYCVSTYKHGEEHIAVYVPMCSTNANTCWKKSIMIKDRLGLIESGAQQISAHLLNITE